MKKLIIGSIVWFLVIMVVMLLFENPYLNVLVILMCIANLMLLAPKDKKKNHIDYDND